VCADGLFVDGDWVESKDQDPSGEVRLIQLADVGDGRYTSKSNRFLTTASATNLDCTFLNPGDVLIARMPDPLGRACVFPGDSKRAVTVVDVAVFRSGKKGIDHRWLVHAINATQTRAMIETLASGTTRSRISRGNLATVKFPVPPLNEQSRIVEKLDAIFEQTRAARARLERLPGLLEKLKRSILAAAFRGDLPKDWRAAHPDVEPASVLLDRIRTERRHRWESALRAKGKAVDKEKYCEHAAADSDGLPYLPEGWSWAKLDQLCDVGTGATPKRGESHFWSGGTIPWVTSGATNAEFIDVATEFVTSHALEETNLTLFPSGTLLVAMYGEGQTRGRCAELTIASTTNQAVAALVTAMLPDSLKQVMKFVLWHRYEALRMAASGGVQPNLNLGIVRSIVIPVPPLDEQAILVDQLRRLSAGIDAMTFSIENTCLRVAAVEQAALAKAFRGELVPQDPTDEPASVLLDRIRAARAAEPDRPRRGRAASATPPTAAAPSSPGPNRGAADADPLDLIVATFQASPRLAASAIVRTTGLDLTTVKQALKTLVEAGQVRVESKARATTYVWTA